MKALFPGRVGVPPAVSRVPRETAGRGSAAILFSASTVVRSAWQDAGHGRRDAHPTQGTVA